MAAENRGSVTRAIDDLQAAENQDEAASKLWEIAFGKLVKTARALLRDAPRRVADEEDVALSAFHSLCAGVVAGRFPNLESRDNLWRLLYTITKRKVSEQKAHDRARKRDSGRTDDEDVETIKDSEPNHEFVVMMLDDIRHKMEILRDDNLRQVAQLILDELDNEEIAAQFGCSVRTIERKRKLIRKAWEREQSS
jgi:DNA-directed RNA polymerase specialized sigma24 family protein